MKIAAFSLAAAIAAAAPAFGALAELNVATGVMETADSSFRATDMTIAKDFKLELLYNVPTATQGAWVPMAFDTRGRLIVASYQAPEFLGRLTIPKVGEPGQVQVERILENVGAAEGLLVANNSLYISFNRTALRTPGVYRITDTNNDDKYDTMVPVRVFPVGGGDHGKHALRLDPNGQRIHLLNGNDVAPTIVDSSRVPFIWGEDNLLPRLDDKGLGGHAAGRFAPGGYTVSFKFDGADLRLETIGYRNAVDFEFNKDGELFVYDSDMEWDKGMPFYRPTRVTHAISGSDVGWRHGAGPFHPWYIDSWGVVAPQGSGSPVGMTVGTGAKFPARYQDALYLSDWSYGNYYAVQMAPKGSTYTGKSELFASGQPFAVAGTLVNKADGSLLVQTTNSQLYRITYIGSESTAPTTPDTSLAGMRNQRKRLEEFHGRREAGIVNTVWPELANADRGIRHAARIALEWQDPAQWRDRALAETNPRIAIPALVSLSRVSSYDTEHRPNISDAPVPDKALQARILQSLDRIAWNPLPVEDKLDLLRAYSLALSRFGEVDPATTQFHGVRGELKLPDEATRARLIAKFDPLFPTEYRELNWEMGEILAYLDTPSLPAKMMTLIKNAPTKQYFPIEEFVNPQQRTRGVPGTLGGRSQASLAKQEDQIMLAEMLRSVDNGWTPALREEYLAWFKVFEAPNTPENVQTRYEGGASFRATVVYMKNKFLLKMSDAEKAALVDKSLLEPLAGGGGGRGGGGGGGGGFGGAGGGAAGPAGAAPAPAAPAPRGGL